MKSGLDPSRGVLLTSVRSLLDDSPYVENKFTYIG
jgi:hypothetical protein